MNLVLYYPLMLRSSKGILLQNEIVLSVSLFVQFKRDGQGFGASFGALDSRALGQIP